jgi:hypothetical protein
MAIQSCKEERGAGLGRDRFRIGVLFNMYQKLRSRIEAFFKRKEQRFISNVSLGSFYI